MLDKIKMTALNKRLNRAEARLEKDRLKFITGKECKHVNSRLGPIHNSSSMIQTSVDISQIKTISCKEPKSDIEQWINIQLLEMSKRKNYPLSECFDDKHKHILTIVVLILLKVNIKLLEDMVYSIMMHKSALEKLKDFANKAYRYWPIEIHSLMLEMHK